MTATAVNPSGKTALSTSSFRTLTPSATFSAITALGDQTYGVGMPIMITFSSPVTPGPGRGGEGDRDQELQAGVGAWMWDGNEALDFRHQELLASSTPRSASTRTSTGLEFAPGVFGTANLSQSFTIGNSLIGVTSTRTHHTRIYWKNKLLRGLAGLQRHAG